MTVIGINGGPRKGWNTHILLTKALEGAASAGAQTELINLYDLDYKGCISCLACKLKDGSGTECAMKDDLSAVLHKIAGCSALIIGSPIYFGEVTGMARAFIERLLFPYISYDKDRTSRFGRRIKTALIYTMNVPEDFLEQVGYTDKFKGYEQLLERLLGPAQTMLSTETLQVSDYTRYNMTMFDPAARQERREKVFPDDCRRAFELGASLASTVD